MKILCRLAMLSALTMSPIPPSAFTILTARAGASAPSTTKVKKRKKHKKNKEVVLKSHHGKRARKPA